MLFPPIAVNNVNSRDHNMSWDPEDAKSSNNIANSRANNRCIPGSNISRDAGNSRYTVLAAVGTPRTEELQATFPVSRRP